MNVEIALKETRPSLRGMGYAYLSGYFAIRVFLMWRRPTPCAPSRTKVRRWNVGSPTRRKRNQYFISNGKTFPDGLSHLEPSQLPRMSRDPADRRRHCASLNIYLGTASSCDWRWNNWLEESWGRKKKRKDGLDVSAMCSQPPRKFYFIVHWFYFLARKKS